MQKEKIYWRWTRLLFTEFAITHSNCSAKTIFLCHCVCESLKNRAYAFTLWNIFSPHLTESVVRDNLCYFLFHRCVSQASLDDWMHAHTHSGFPSRSLSPPFVCDKLWNVDKYGWMVSELMDKDMRFEGFYHLLSACSIAFELDSPPIDSDYFQQQQKLLANELRFFPFSKDKKPMPSCIHTCMRNANRR